MSDGGQESSLRVTVDEALERDDGEEVAALVSDLPSTAVEVRRTCLRSLKAAVADDSSLVKPALPACKAFLEDDEHSVRLMTAKLFVVAAQTDPNAVIPMVPVLVERLPTMRNSTTSVLVRRRHSGMCARTSRHRSHTRAAGGPQNRTLFRRARCERETVEGARTRRAG